MEVIGYILWQDGSQHHLALLFRKWEQSSAGAPANHSVNDKSTKNTHTHNSSQILHIITMGGIQKAKFT